MKIIVLSSGGHARVVVEALRSRNLNPFAMTDRNPDLKGAILFGLPVIGADNVVEELGPGNVVLANGLGNRARQADSGLGPRRQLFDHYLAKGYHFPQIVHAHAFVASDAELGEGTQVMAGAIVQSGASVGVNAVLNSGSLIEHDCKVGPHVHIAPGATLCGGTVVGEESHIGARAIILQGVKIGPRAVIAAGAIVTRDIAEQETYGISR